MNPIILFSIEFQQHPKTQHVIDGTSAVFSCVIADAATTYWDVTFPSGSSASYRRPQVYTEQGIILERNVQSDDVVYTTLTINAQLSRNNTQLNCIGHARGKRRFSETAFLIVYSSLRKFLLIHNIIGSLLRTFNGQGDFTEH